MKSGQLQEKLIIFTRYPEPGTTKTRLARVLGDRRAAATQRKLTELTMAQAAAFSLLQPATVCVYYDGGSLEQMQQWLGPVGSYRHQGPGDLGQRMAAAFAASFKQGYERVVIIGTDCPGLTAHHIIQAFEILLRNDLVLGPASDGGYYLIGLRRLERALFAGVSWGTGTVLARTLETAARQGLAAELLETLHDIDRPSDLKHLHIPARGSGSPLPCYCSIVIPTRNEAANIVKLLPEIVSLPGIEVLVVDGGSGDNTAAVAAALGARVMTAAGGRAGQLNAGARAARGDILLFLHADTRLPPGFTALLRSTLAQPGVVAGAFRLAIDGRGRGLRLVEWLANLRSRFLQMPYGDQGIFVTAAMFAAVGGFPPLPIMEDFELVRRLRRQGRIKILPAAATTSCRRWHRLGILRTTIINQALVIGYLLGVAPHKLAARYRKE